jgi:hypothetical protein
LKEDQTKRIGTISAPAYDVARAPPRRPRRTRPARTLRRRETPRSEARAAATVNLRLMTRVRGLGRCHAACAYSPAGEPPCAIGRRLRRTSPPPPRPSPNSCRPRRCRATASACPRAYKTLPAPFPRAPEQLCHPLSSAIGAADDLAAPLAPFTNQRP